ncbi:Flp pilus assembly protein CpaB, partial [Mesorhizobium sp. M4B.F.Ca.ET.169.01.1.1]|uniref:RcpC/CpaB family pilus assembly protein n=1 Tax=Mesorhizobium sp. M4B.F.Ca.ET.169.01.1.1 TaxID=2563949 RepID=UPI0011350108
GEIQEVAKNAQGAAGSTITSEIVVADAKVLSVGQGADERQTTPQVANSVTIEGTSDGAQKVALARTVGTLSLSLRSASEGGAGKNGVTTISSFG